MPGAGQFTHPGPPAMQPRDHVLRDGRKTGQHFRDGACIGSDGIGGGAGGLVGLLFQAVHEGINPGVAEGKTVGQGPGVEDAAGDRLALKASGWCCRRHPCIADLGRCLPGA